MPKHATLVGLAKALGISRKTLGRWQSLPGFPDRGPEGWDSSAIKKWRESQTEERRTKKRVSHKRAARAKKTAKSEVPEQGAEPTPTEQASLTFADKKAKADAEYREIKAEQALLDLKRSKGLLIPREDVEAMFVERVHEVKTRIGSLGRALAPQLVGKVSPREIESRIDEATREICEHFARAIPVEWRGETNQ